ncbi:MULTISPECIES: DapH/DapD/GlmU-related protein [unclassified Haladaptatus]|uniref:acyltransferase n=1 Tax=unclassified Haladaptatus TaxID=2622732 RepID=UPI00209C2A2D|nr:MULTISPECIES: DapH/DapD/GlmU-related protein [unclassified Haladaptatus]MCO8246699.1 hypothetical protein [Haladaptatus sp. AB643]MCO8256347.1 hypothetical protein [Haladaptatus sp. AB618]
MVNDIESRDKVFEWARLVNTDNLELGENVEIDDFVLVNAGDGTYIGDNSCLHSGTKLIGGGEFYMGRNSVVTYNCVLVTGYPKFTSHMSSGVPADEKDRVQGTIRIEDEVFVGSGSVVMPDVTLGEGAVVGALSYVDEDVPPWTIRYPDGTEMARPQFEPY